VAQRQFFVALRAEVEKRKALPADRVQSEIPAMREAMLTQHATYIDADPKAITDFGAQVAKVYRELTGNELKKPALEQARRTHESHHGNSQR
jgi:hypothetical protein